MPAYTIRVLLRSPSTAADYQSLHDKMEANGAVRQITGDSGLVYDLPQAEYYLSSDFDAETVRDRVVTIAMSVDSDPEVYVTEALSFAWRLKLAA